MAISNSEWLGLFPAKYREQLRAEIYGQRRADGMKRTECTRKEAVARVLNDLLLDPVVKQRLEEAANFSLVAGHPMIWSIIRGLMQEIPPLKKPRVWFRAPPAQETPATPPAILVGVNQVDPAKPPPAAKIIEFATKPPATDTAEPA